MAAARAGHGFRHAHKLHGTDEFSSVFAFRRVLRGRFYVLHYRPNGLETARLGLAVAKKIVRRASGRNLLKRIAREVFRLQREDLPACDLIVRVHAPTTSASRAELHQDLRQLLSRLPSLPRGIAISV
ncbi:MAG: ribonuclease P protein component [Azoarcus sp.]|jgi:ribonuclease P protein component|nr:ribonuclease P protein component [Azoarcus sp.]